MESLFANKSCQHTNDGGPFAVRDAVEDFVDLVGMVNDDADGMAGLERIETHHVLQVPRHKLLEPFEARLNLEQGIKQCKISFIMHVMMSKTHVFGPEVFGVTSETLVQPEYL